MASEDTATPSAPIGEIDVEQLVRGVLADEGLLAADSFTLPADADLREAGLTSLRMVQLVMAIEERCSRTIPDESLSRSRFATIGSVTDLVREVIAMPAEESPELSR
jgi:acyl carrier protein